MGGKLKYLLLLVFLSVMAVLYNQYIMFLLLLVFLILPLVLLLSVLFLRLSVSTQVTVANPVVEKGRPFSLTVQLQNKAFIPVTNAELLLVYRNQYEAATYEKKLPIFASARETRTFACTLSTERSGMIEVQFKRLRVQDVLGLFSMCVKISSRALVSVLPRRVLLDGTWVRENLSVMQEGELYSTVKAGDDPSEVLKIRAFTQGDRLNRLHRQLSRKTDAWMVKEFGLPIDCGLLILLDLYCEPDGGAYFDGLLDVLASLSYTLLLGGRPHTVAWLDEKAEFCKNIRVMTEEDFYQMLSELLSAKPQQQYVNPLERQLAQVGQSAGSGQLINPYSNLFVLSQQTDGRLLEEARMQQGVSMLTYVFAADCTAKEADALRRGLAQTGDRCCFLRANASEEELRTLGESLAP